MTTPEIRFWNKVTKSSACWTWTGSLGGSRYGVFKLNGKLIKAHRASWVFSGKTIPDGMKVLHRCDNPVCVNPDHLFIGTQRDNILDMENKGRGRHPSGANHSKAKLSEESVEFIRNSKIPMADLARQFGVARQSVFKIKRNINWRKS